MKYMNIAIRNLSRQKKRSLLLGGAIAFGILMITLVNSFTAGAVRNAKDGIAEVLAGHVYIGQETKREDGEIINELTNDSPVLEALSNMGYGDDSLIKRSSMGGAVIIFNGRETGQEVVGVDWDRETSLKKRINLSAGSLEEAIADPRGIIISGSAAETLAVEIGEELTLRASTVTGQQNVGKFVVQGIMVDSSFIGSFSSYANLSRVNEMINIPPNSYQDLRLTLSALEQADEVTDRLYETLSTTEQLAPRDDRNLDLSFNTVFQDEEEEPWEGTRYVINNIQDFTFVIDQLSSTLNNVGLGVLVVLIIITMVGVVNTFRMIMFERVKEIGTMRAVGVQRSGVRKIFLWEAFGLGTLGYVIGIVLAIVGSQLLRIFTIPADSPFSVFTLSGKLVFPLSFVTLAFNYVLMVGFTIIAASFPAGKAAKSSPAEALRA